MYHYVLERSNTGKDAFLSFQHFFRSKTSKILLNFLISIHELFIDTNYDFISSYVAVERVAFCFQNLHLPMLQRYLMPLLAISQCALGIKMMSTLSLSIVCSILLFSFIKSGIFLQISKQSFKHGMSFLLIDGLMNPRRYNSSTRPMGCLIYPRIVLQNVFLISS